MRTLVLVLGDQLDRGSAAFDGFDPARDVVWMAEVAEESTHVWTHRARIAVFLAGMRHFRDALLADGIRVEYTELSPQPRAGEAGSLAAALATSLAAAGQAGHGPERLVLVEPGEWRVREAKDSPVNGTSAPVFGLMSDS
jgi:deoxyribodipyrimidine photolyase-related protein